MKRNFLLLFLCVFIGMNAYTQVEEPKNRPPVFTHPKHPHILWRDYLVMYGRGEQFKKSNFCFAGRIFVECVLSKDAKFIEIKFSDNTPELIKKGLTSDILASEKYWKPKKVNGKFVESKLCLIWTLGINRGCKEKESYLKIDKDYEELGKTYKPVDQYLEYKDFDIVQEANSPPYSTHPRFFKDK